ncbi:MAG: hypothetical protein WCD16_06900 [Paracoccaceae bacterium]
MTFYRRAFSVCATLLVAFGAGYLVQNADHFFGSAEAPAPERVGDTYIPAPNFEFDKVTPMATQDMTAAPADTTPANRKVDIPSVPEAAFRAPRFSTDTSALATRMKKLDDGFRTPASEGRNLNQYGLPCESDLSAKPAPGGMIELNLKATCRSDSKVEISQDRLHFAAMTTNTGTLTIQIPALSTSPVIVAQLPDGEILTASAEVPDAAEYQRVALQWRDGDEMHIHAYEFGAGYDDAGHVWADNPRSPEMAVKGKGGFLTALGATDAPDPQLAEVYSFPRGRSLDSGVVRVSIEVEVTQSNCNREISGETLQPGAGGHWRAADLVLPVPDCDAIGEFLVLKNILRDMKIARN